MSSGKKTDLRKPVVNIPHQEIKECPKCLRPRTNGFVTHYCNAGAAVPVASYCNCSETGNHEKNKTA